MRLISSTTGEEITTAAMLTHVSDRTRWRFEAITCRTDGRIIHVSRYERRVSGRVHAHFHPDAFGVRVEVTLTRVQVVTHHARRVWLRVDDWVWAGVIALVPLAFFERFHMADMIVSAFGFTSGAGH